MSETTATEKNTRQMADVILQLAQSLGQVANLELNNNRLPVRMSEQNGQLPVYIHICAQYVLSNQPPVYCMFIA